MRNRNVLDAQFRLCILASCAKFWFSLLPTRGQNATATHAIAVQVAIDAPASADNSVNVYEGGAGDLSGYDFISIALAGYEGWRQHYFPGSTATTGPGANLATLAHDGVCNLLKFATGMNPTVQGQMPGLLVKNAGQITFTYTPSIVAVAAGFGFRVEYNDLPGVNLWASDIVNQGILGSGGSPVTATLPIGADEQRFVHLKVSKP